MSVQTGSLRKLVALAAFGGSMCIACILNMTAQAPSPIQSGRGGRGRAPQPAVISPEVTADRHITFRINAPQAQAVRMNASDIPNLGLSAALSKGDNGVWSTTVGPVEPGAYRYSFTVDGVATIDPRSPSISESNANVWSLVYVPGADFMDAKDIPARHGGFRELLLDGTWKVAPHACVHAAWIRNQF